MRGELTVGLIRPEAVDHTDEIRTCILNCGLIIYEARLFEWTSLRKTEEYVGEFCYHQPEAIRAETIRRFFKRRTPVLLIHGPDCIDKFLRLTGTCSNPNECDCDTLRYRWGSHEPVELEGGIKFWSNGIHRPSTPEEATWDLATFFGIEPRC